MRRVYRPDIDGLRAIAIVSVVLFHAGLGGITGGFTGVDIFFVISGFLIGGHIYSDLERGRFSFLAFYKRRVKRILPALYVVLTATLLLGCLVLSPYELSRLGNYTMASVASASNIVLSVKQSYFAFDAHSNLLLMTWSLGVEEQFYLVIPFLLVALSRLQKRQELTLIGLVFAVSFALSWMQLGRYPAYDFYLLHTRAWELAAGVGLAILYEMRRSRPFFASALAANGASVAGVALIAAPLFLLNSNSPFPGPAALPSVLGTALLIATENSWINRRLFSLAPVVFIGRVSYSWYLWHWPLLTFLRILYGEPLPLSYGLAAAVVSLLLAIATYYFVEQPFRASKRQALPLILRYVAVSAALGVIAFAVVATGGLRSRYPQVARVEAAREALAANPCLVLYGSSQPSRAAVCNRNAPSTIVLWGDSHAASLGLAMGEIAADHGFGLLQMTKSNCPPLVGVGRSSTMQVSQAEECIKFNQNVIQRITSDSSVKTVILTGSWGAPFQPDDDSQLLQHGQSDLPGRAYDRSLQNLQTSLRATLQALRAANKQVVVFGDVPRFPMEPDPILRYRGAHMPLRRDLIALLHGGSWTIDPGQGTPIDGSPLELQVRTLIGQVALSVPGVTYRDLRTNVCDASGVCIYRQGEVMDFADAQHVTRAGAFKVLEGWTPPAALP